MAEYEAVIGLEVHVQLSTATKIFCSCRSKIEGSVADETVNTNVCPVCAGHPGSLPVLNRKAVEYAVMAGLATNCRVNPHSVFARKNYFYPDLPKGYQISQFDLPLCENGYLEIERKSGETFRVQLERIHMEEDAGKNVHMSGFSLVNLNRAGTPLIEVVSRPDMRSPEEAGAYLRALYAIVTYLGICEGNLQEGNFRCDANVSVRPKGQKELNTRAEIKNVNSFRFVEKAIEFEIARQIEVTQSGGKIVQETRTYDSAKNITISMRSKEEAHDYRYFPEPDLIPLMIDEKWVEEVRDRLPELPANKKARFISEFGLKAYDAGVLTASRALGLFFESTLSELEKADLDRSTAAKTAANLLSGEISRLMNDSDLQISDSKLNPTHLADTVLLLGKDEISSTAAKQILQEAWASEETVQKIVERLGLRQVSDSSELEPVIDEILKNNPQQVEQFRAGKEKLLGFFVGQAMKASQGKANPRLLQDLVKKKLKGE